MPQSIPASKALNRKKDALLGGRCLIIPLNIPEERVEAQLYGIVTDGLDGFEPLIARVQEVGLQPIVKLDAQRQSEAVSSHSAASSTPPEPVKAGC